MPEDKVCVRLGDFGLSKYMDDFDERPGDNLQLRKVPSKIVTDSNVEIYAAPEANPKASI